MRRRAATTLGLALAICALAPATASAGLLSGICTLAGDTPVGKWVGVGCKVAGTAGKVVGIVKKVVGVVKKVTSGGPGSALHTILSGGSKAAPQLGLAAIVTWVLGGAAFALHETATLLGKTTNPELGAGWFSSTYVHMAAIATLLTLPFLFAAAIQALMRSDLAMLGRAAFGSLPLAMLAIAIAAPLTTLLLTASDSLSKFIEQAAGGDGTAFLVKSSLILGGLTALAHSPFVAFLIGFFVAAGALTLWLELVLREVAVYVVVLSLPLVFAAFVWPARRVWAVRAVEVLVALILAKLAIVSVLALGAGALHHATASVSIVSFLAGIALVVLGAFAPWALVKLLPLGELAAAAAGPLRGPLEAAWRSGEKNARPWGQKSEEWAEDVVAGMHRDAMAADPTPADAEAARLADLKPERATDGVEGVAAGDSPDPLLGTADPPDGPIPGASSEPAPPGTPGPPATPASPGAPAPSVPPGAPDAAAPPPENEVRPERGPAPRFEGFEGGEAFWQHREDPPAVWLGPEGSAPPPEDDDPRPPAQEPEDGLL